MSNKRLWIIGGAAALLILLCASIWVWNTSGQAKPLLNATQVGEQIQAQYPGEITSVVKNNDAYIVQLESDKGRYELNVSAQNGKVQSIRQLQGTQTVATATGTEATASSSSNEATTSTSDSAPATSGSATVPTTDSSSTTSAPGDNGSTATPTEPANTESNRSKVESNMPASTPTTAPSSTQSVPDPVVPGGKDESSSTTPNKSPKEDDKDKLPSPRPHPASPGKKDASSSTVPYASNSLTEKQAEQIALRQVKGKVDDVDFKHSGKTGQQYYLVDIDTPDDREAVIQINAISGEVMSITWDDEDDADDKD